jgi:hypothetical protein
MQVTNLVIVLARDPALKFKGLCTTRPNHPY